MLFNLLEVFLSSTVVFKAIDFVGQNLDSYITQLHSIYCQEENENVLFTQLFSEKQKTLFWTKGREMAKITKHNQISRLLFSSQNR